MNAFRSMVIAALCVGSLPLVATAQPAAATAAAQPAATSAPAGGANANWSSYPPDVQAQAIRDQEWLTAYMMAHQGYRLDHMEALEDKFSKMSPTQLETLKMFYEQKHQAMVQQQQLFQQAQANQIAQAQAQIQKQNRAMGLINQEETGAATTEDQRLNQMHREAFEANQDKQSMQYPYGMGGYMNPYGGYGPYGPYRP